MKRLVPAILAILSTAFACLGLAQNPSTTRAATEANRKHPKPIGRPSFLSPHATPILISDRYVFVTNTQADTVDVIDAITQQIATRISVGIQPVGLAIRPDGKELWVANHVSDSISVIDIDPTSLTHFQVVATIQNFDNATKSTRFDEPVGIAFAGNTKAYVSLSSENKIAVIDVLSRKVINQLNINAQDPRAIIVRGDRLYVVPFESNNKTQLSGGTGKIDGDLVTFNAYEHSIKVNNVLSLGHVVDIIKHPRVPDHDLYVFDTKSDVLIKVVDTLGTLLYGMTVDSQGQVYIAQTDARNDVNGRAGSKKHGLAELENRAFLNRITKVSFDVENQATTSFLDLEPLPPNNPRPSMALATPYAIEVSGDDSTIVATAAGSNKLVTLDTKTGEILGRAQVGAEPEGVALESSQSGRPTRAWVLNAASDTVSLVDLSSLTDPKVINTITLEDPTHPAVKRGRIAFHNAEASTTGTFSCASCHPDGNTDQLLWVLNTPIVSGGNQIMPRSTMPVRGLRDTAPFHWDGVPGDPYGGINSASVHKPVPANSSADRPESSTRHLVDGGLATTMSIPGDKSVNDEGKLGKLSSAERDDMATFLLGVPFPPAQRRAYTNVLSDRASNGFKLFHIDGDLDPGKAKPNVCGDCHRMPFWVSTNTPGTGMDAPTWRGAYDRWLILPQGRLNIIDFDFFRRVAEQGTPERNVWQFSWGGRPRFDPVWDMVLEGSTGFSGAFGRQVTLNRQTVGDTLTSDLLDALEQGASDGGILLQSNGVMIQEKAATPVVLEYDPETNGGNYVDQKGARNTFSRSDLKALAAEGKFVGTFTGRVGENVDVDNPQPALWTLGPIEKQRGRQEFPVVSDKKPSMTVSGRHIQPEAFVLVDGRKVAGKVSCEGETVEIELASLPGVGMHFLQLQNRDGLVSNDFIFHVGGESAAAKAADGKTLGSLLRKTHWDRIIGTWLDSGSNGAGLKMVYAWKYTDRLIEVTNIEPNKQSVALIGMNSEIDEVRHVGGGSAGDLFSGTWEFKADGDSLLRVGYVSAEGRSGSINIRHQLLDDDTLMMTLELPDPIRIKFIRAKERK